MDEEDVLDEKDFVVEEGGLSSGCGDDGYLEVVNGSDGRSGRIDQRSGKTSELIHTVSLSSNKIFILPVALLSPDDTILVM